MFDMDRSIQLVSVVTTYDAIGQPVSVETLKKVFARVRSVSVNEWTQAGQLGLSASYQITIWAHEYNREEYVILDNRRYHVYRTYETGDTIELYVDEMIGHD